MKTLVFMRIHIIQQHNAVSWLSQTMMTGILLINLLQLRPQLSHSSPISACQKVPGELRVSEAISNGPSLIALRHGSRRQQPSHGA